MPPALIPSATRGTACAPGLVGRIRQTSHKSTDITYGCLQLAELWHNNVVEKVIRPDDEGC
jgi:hypothetical protein